jgi:DnaJ-class molecular chaperone
LLLTSRSEILILCLISDPLLIDIYKGTVKNVKITRKVYSPNGRAFINEDKILTCTINPGMKAGTKITFQNEGNQTPNNIPGDVV